MKSVAVILAIASIIAGCATTSGGDSGGVASPNCDGTAACKVRVSVSDCVITATPATLDVTVKNINIFWDLDPLSSFAYRFPDDGIKLKVESAEFNEPEAQALRKKFKLHDKNDLSGTTHRYEYAIKVQKLEGFSWVDCPKLDPWVVNH